METNNFYTEYKCGKTVISRDLLESLPEPFDTTNVSDKTMQAIANDVENEMKEYYEWEKNGDVTHDKVSEKWWETLERSVIEHGVTYYYN